MVKESGYHQQSNAMMEVIVAIEHLVMAAVCYKSIMEELVTTNRELSKANKMLAEQMKNYRKFHTHE
eukprot:1398001-Ditylum_brightwellii.AAC.1